MYVIYHGQCYDGFTAAWIASRAMPGAILLPALYGEPIPDTPEGSDVYMLDIAYPHDQLAEYARTRHLRILDHHKSRERELDGLDHVFDLTKSGAMLAWQEFRGASPVAAVNPPLLVLYTQDRDLWHNVLPKSAEIGCYIESFPRDLDAYDTLCDDLETNLAHCAEIGASLLRYKQQRVHEIADQAVLINLCSYGVPLVNTSCLTSEVAHELCQRFPYSFFAAYYFRRADGLTQVGLRTIDATFDVSEVAMYYQGGGGHRAAAGFEVTDDEMSALLRSGALTR